MLPAVAVVGASGAPTHPTASVGAAPSVLTSFALVSLDFTGSTDPAGGGLTYSCTLDVKPTSSATTLVDATTSTPDFTPDKIGTYSGVLTVTDINGRTDTSRWFREVRSALTLSIAAVSPSNDLADAALDSTATGGIGTITYVWTLTGPDGTDQSALLSSTTAADPTAAISDWTTGAAAGLWLAECTATDTAGQVARRSVSWRVGTATGWVLLWKAITADLSDHDFNTTATKTVDGVDVTRSYDGTTPTTHAISSGVWTIDTVTGGGNGAGVSFAPVQKLDNLAAYEVCFMVGIGASLAADSDGVFVAYVGAGGTYALAEARRAAGVQTLFRQRNDGETGLTISGGAQARVVGAHLSPQRVGFRPLYSTTAWTGNGPTPDDLTVGGGTPSGWHVTLDKTTAATTDAFAPNNDVGASPDTVQVKGRAHNGAAYTLAGITYWVRGL